MTDHYPRTEFARLGLSRVALDYLQNLNGMTALVTSSGATAAEVAALTAAVAALTTALATAQADILDGPLYDRPTPPQTDIATTGELPIYVPLVDALGNLVLSPDGKIIPKLWGTSADA